LITFVLRRILFIFGTRPEAIKLCPVVLHMRRHPDQFDARVCVTGQHREMLDQVLAAFDVDSDHDLDVMRPGQTLFQSTARILAGLEEVFEAETPDMVLVQGDTTTTLCGALAAKRVMLAFFADVDVAGSEPWIPATLARLDEPDAGTVTAREFARMLSSETGTGTGSDARPVTRGEALLMMWEKLDRH